MSLLNDSADQDLPREKIYKYGAASLSNAELMAIFLTSGIVGRNVIQVAGDLLEKYGGLQELGRLSVAEYMNNKGIGLAKACKLAAAFELGSRLSREKIRLQPLDSPELIYEHFGPSRKKSYRPRIETSFWISLSCLRMLCTLSDATGICCERPSSESPQT